MFDIFLSICPSKNKTGIALRSANLEWKFETEAKKEKNVVNLPSKEKF